MGFFASFFRRLVSVDYLAGDQDLAPERGKSCLDMPPPNPCRPGRQGYWGDPLREIEDPEGSP